MSEHKVEPVEQAYADKSALDRWRGRRRIVDFDWPGVGRVRLQSATAREFIRIEAARQRALVAANGGKTKEHEQATREFLLLVCRLLVLDGDGQPFFSDADNDLVLALDSAITDPLVEAALKHCGLESVDLEAAQKN